MPPMTACFIHLIVSHASHASHASGSSGSVRRVTTTSTPKPVTNQNAVQQIPSTDNTKTSYNLGQRTLKKGMEGDDVLELKKALVRASSRKVKALPLSRVMSHSESFAMSTAMGFLSTPTGSCRISVFGRRQVVHPGPGELWFHRASLLKYPHKE